MEFRVVGFTISIANVYNVKELVKRNIGKKLSSKDATPTFNKDSSWNIIFNHNRNRNN